MQKILHQGTNYRLWEIGEDFEYLKKSLVSEIIEKEALGKSVSISDKDGKYLAIAWSESPIGIDVETIIKRKDEIYDKFGLFEYQLLGAISKELAFYILWSAKEAAFKRLRLKRLEDIYEIQTIEAQKIHEKTYQITLKYIDEIITLESIFLDNIVLSISNESSLN